jgi:3-dehydroquinate synthase
MVIAAQLSQRIGLITGEDTGRIVDILKRARLPITAPDFGTDRYFELMGHDKKVESGRIRFVLLRRIGEALVTAEVPADALAEVLGKPSGHG